MASKAKYIFVIAIILSFLEINNSIASMTLPYYVANNETKECGLFFSGDECFSRRPAKGWEVIDYYRNESYSPCPKNYTHVQEEDIPIGEVFLEQSFMCCESRGQCDRVIINQNTQKCALVLTLENCRSLPKGWEFANKSEELLAHCRYSNLDNYELLAYDIPCNNKSGYRWILYPVIALVSLLLIIYLIRKIFAI